MLLLETKDQSTSAGRAVENGQAMPEFVIILPVLLFIVLGTLQFAFIYHAKITLNYATFESVRAGSLNNARSYAMANAMARSLAPLYTHADTVAAYKQARERVRNEINNGYLRIDIINPSPNAFSDYGRNQGGEVQIANDNLIYRGATIGKDSNQTIQDANLLKIQTYYCFELIVPFVNRIIWSMMRYSPNEIMPANLPELKKQHRFGKPATGSFNEECVVKKNAADGYFGIPIRSQAIIRMQTPAIFGAP